jgi:hypothetical protein
MTKKSQTHTLAVVGPLEQARDVGDHNGLAGVFFNRIYLADAKVGHYRSELIAGDLRVFECV